METEFIALDSPTSDFISDVKAGTAEPIGLNTSKTSAFRTSFTKGIIRKKKTKTC